MFAMAADQSERVLSIGGLVAARLNGSPGFRLTLDRLDLASCRPVAVVGASGSGKSTFLDVLGLVMTPARIDRFALFPAGIVAVDLAELIAHKNEKVLTDMRRRHFGYMPQTGGLLPFLRVGENIQLPARLNGRVDAGFLDETARLLDLPGTLMRRFPQDLSIGQRQRVSLARAMAHRPTLLLADEPTASLDGVTAAAVTELLLDLLPRFGITPIIATHDERLFQGNGVRRLYVRYLAEAEPGLVEAVVGE